PSRDLAAGACASASRGSYLCHSEGWSTHPEQQGAGRRLLQRQEIQLREIVHVDEGPAILSGTDVPRGTFFLSRLDEPSRNAASPAIHNCRTDQHPTEGE